MVSFVIMERRRGQRRLSRGGRFRTPKAAARERYGLIGLFGEVGDLDVFGVNLGGHRASRGKAHPEGPHDEELFQNLLLSSCNDVREQGAFAMSLWGLRSTRPQ
jgi:hypothetical protein